MSTLLIRSKLPSASVATPRLLAVRWLSSTRPALREGKLWDSADEAVADIKSGSMILSAGFGLCGTAGNSGDGGLAPLIKSGQVSSMILSFLGSNKALETAYLTGKVSLELSPQGTLAERIACGGKGIPGFYSATGAGTFVESGRIPRKFAPRGLKDPGPLKVELQGVPKDVKIFPDGKRYLLEPAIKGDVAIVRAWKVDKAGNCVFRYATRAFGPLMARAAALTIVEAENIVEIGEIHAMDINLPGIYVDRIVPATVEKRIELVTTTPSSSPSATPPEASESPNLSPEKIDAKLRREKIAKRAAKELKDGFYVNLGVGMPTLAVSYLKPEVKVWLQSENGILGMGPYPHPDAVDADLVNAGKETVTLVPGASVFDSVESFGMIRGGHVDVSILGAMEVSAGGDLASYYIPGKMVKGMGGSMDLCSNPDQTKIIVTTDHTDKHGNSKIRRLCTLPLTAEKCVSRIITNLCVFDVDRVNGVLTLIELADGVSVEDVKAKTEADFLVAESVGRMEDE